MLRVPVPVRSALGVPRSRTCRSRSSYCVSGVATSGDSTGVGPADRHLASSSAMRKLYVIGIGAGDPDQMTVQAIKAMRKAEAFFVIGKRAEKQELVDVRNTIQIGRAHV